MGRQYLTIAPDLIEHADAAVTFLRGQGYAVKVEPSDVSFPATPTLMGVRQSVRHYLEVNSAYRHTQIMEWKRYAISRQHETYVSLVVPIGTTISGGDLDSLRKGGIGLYHCDGNNLNEIVMPRDLALPLALPNLAGEKRDLRVMMAPIYQQFDRTEWVNGFRDACQLAEDHARKRLVEAIRNGKASFIRKGASVNVSMKQANKMTLGQLAVAYGELAIPDHVDMTVRKALESINPDRVNAVHHINKSGMRGRLRKRVFTHIFTIVNALRAMS